VTEVRKQASTHTTVAGMTRSSLGEFTNSERKVARALLSAYPVAGLETVVQLAGRAEVSPPTVIRFVARLGFDGYPAFQAALRHEVDESMGSPLKQYVEKRQASEGKQLLPFAASTFVDGISATFTELPAPQFERAVELLCDTKLSVYTVGGRFSRVLSDYLTAHLQLLRRGVSIVAEDEQSRLAMLADGGRGQLFVVFDYRRYDPEVVRLAELLAHDGAKILLLTDRWLSPIADFAEVVLPARVEAPSPFDSLVPAMAVVESLVAAVTDRLDDAGRRRLERIESGRDELRSLNGTE